VVNVTSIASLRLDCTALFTRLHLTPSMNEQMLSTRAFATTHIRVLSNCINTHAITRVLSCLRQMGINVHLHTTHNVLVESLDELNILLDLYQARAPLPINLRLKHAVRFS
jgi:UDP-N-acetylglucosamine enolpyruvyl transferase